MNFGFWILDFGLRRRGAAAASRRCCLAQAIQNPKSKIQNRPRVRPAGFTLIESIATIVIIAVLGSAASFILRASVDSFSRAATSAQLHGEIAAALDRIDRELRNIEAKSGTTVTPNITSVTASSMTWNTDYSVSFSSGRLNFVEDGGASSIILQNVTAFTIQTYNESNAALGATLSGAACDPIRRVSIQITASRNGVTETLRTKVFLRCSMKGA
jgi:prepilin-type N-terminal cleavage/methylation domain-containing protein